MGQLGGQQRYKYDLLACSRMTGTGLHPKHVFCREVAGNCEARVHRSSGSIEGQVRQLVGAREQLALARSLGNMACPQALICMLGLLDVCLLAATW